MLNRHIASRLKSSHKCSRLYVIKSFVYTKPNQRAKSDHILTNLFPNWKKSHNCVQYRSLTIESSDNSSGPDIAYFEEYFRSANTTEFPQQYAMLRKLRLNPHTCWPAIIKSNIDENTLWKTIWPDISASVHVSQIVLHSFMSRLSKSGHYEKLQEVYNTVVEKWPELITKSIYGMLIHGAVTAAKFTEAEQWIPLMKERGFVPDVTIYSDLINGYAKSGNMQKALDLVAEMESEKVEPTVVTWSFIINGYCNLKQTEEALNIYRTLQERNMFPSSIAYSSLMQALVSFKEDGVHDAMQLFRDAQSGKVPLIGDMYRSLIQGYMKCNDKDSASRAYKHFRNNVYNSSTWTFNSM